MNPRMLPTFLATLVATSVLVAPAAALADSRGHRGYGPPPGRVVVTNQSGGDVTLVLGGEVRELPAWRTTELLAMPGEVILRANYKQFGTTQVLETDRLFVNPGRTVSVTLGAEDTARVLVTNQSGFYAQLEVGDRPNASFKPGESRIVSLPLGRAELEMTAEGRTFARTRLDLRPFEEPRWLAEAPRVGSLVVTNPLPIAIQLVCDKGLVRTVAAFGQTRYADLSPGTFRLTARRTTGEYIDRESAEIRVGGMTGWSVDAPRTGFVTLDSDHFLGATVEIDDRRMVDLAPDGQHRAELTVGWHEVEVRDERGREIADRWIEVKPYDVATVAFGSPAHERAYDGRGGRDGRDGRGDDRHAERDEHRGHDDGAAVASGDSCGMH